jgi:hypothetical protein
MRRSNRASDDFRVPFPNPIERIRASPVGEVGWVVVIGIWNERGSRMKDRKMM